MRRLFEGGAYQFFCPRCGAYSSKYSRSLRSNSQDLLMQPTCKTKTYDDRAFSVCAQKIWNTVPLEIRQSSTVLFFKEKLKTFLFTKFIKPRSMLPNYHFLSYILLSYELNYLISLSLNNHCNIASHVTHFSQPICHVIRVLHNLMDSRS